MAVTTRSIQKATRYICIVLFGLAVYKIIQNHTNISKRELMNIAEKVENTFESDLKQILLIHSEKERTSNLKENDLIDQSPIKTLNASALVSDQPGPSHLSAQGEVKTKASTVIDAHFSRTEPEDLPFKASQTSVSLSSPTKRETSNVLTQNPSEGQIQNDKQLPGVLSESDILSSSDSTSISTSLTDFLSYTTSARSEPSELPSASTTSIGSQSLSSSARSEPSKLPSASTTSIAFQSLSTTARSEPFELPSASTTSQSSSNSIRKDPSEITSTTTSKDASESSSTLETESASTIQAQTCTNSTRKKIAWFLVPRWIKDYPNEEMFKDCDYSCCSIDFSATYTDYGQSQNLDAIFFDAHTLLAPEPLLRPPSRDQLWIFFSLEPPPFISRTHWTHENWKHVFNWTMTYRTDSDLVMPYMAVEKNVKDPHYVPKDYDLIMAKKTKKAMWLCSHCVDKHGRMSYVRKLNESIEIDVFGKCGNLMCELTCDAAYDMHKFFIAFENAFCKDYITEKPCNALIRDIVPVVRGGVNHSEFLPPNTYIDANDFESVEDLGKYLNYLDSNDTAYLEYLKNKEGYRFRCNSMITRKPMYCELCKKLHNLDLYGKSIPDITQWLHSCPDEVKVTFDNKNNYKYFN